MELSKYLLDNSPLDQSGFTKIKDREFKPGYDLTSLKYLRDKAGRERDLRELYRGRAPYELLQNADDAKATKAFFILSADGLAFAHDGNWFTVANFRSLADGWSDKDPNQCIGHKGLGFRSVLDLTPSPHLLRLDVKEFFAIKFTWALNNGHFQEALNRDKSLRSHYQDWTKNGQLVCPVMSIPGLANKQGLGSGSAIYGKLVNGDYGSYTTLFWLPVADPEVPKKTLDELSPAPISEDTLRTFLKNEVSILLPFLQSVKEVHLFRMHERVASVVLKPSAGDRDNGVVSVTTDDQGSKSTRSFFQMRFSFSIPPNISTDKQTPKAVKVMKKAGITLSVRINDGQPSADEGSHFHVYFPTEEATGVGFVIHGDFYVKPDRTRLMSAAYNTWLLKAAAQKASNEFLSEMIERYDAAAVFGSLSPSGLQSDAAEVFTDAFSDALSKRKAAYIPSNAGLLTSEEAVLPPFLDADGFWDSHFSEIVGQAIEGKRSFVLPSVDDEATREFFSLAQIEVLTSGQLLDLIEAASAEKPMAWWYECYGFLSQESNLALKDHAYFSGRKLIPISDKSIISVSENRDLVVCLPPRGDTAKLQVPKCFSSSFVFVNSDLAHLLHTGKDSVRNWILDHLQIVRFEASDLLPRAIRNVAPKLYDSRITLTGDELHDLWSFVFRVNQLSRAPIEAAEFWQDIGRLPLPMETTRNTTDSKKFAPASLLYWANGSRDGCLAGVQGLRRIANGFLDELVKSSKTSKSDWISFFSKAGVSSSPQLRTYSRVVASDGETPLNGSLTVEAGPYSGERQRDQNRAALTCLTLEAWAEIVENSPACGHDSVRVLQSLGVVEGLDQALEAAQSEYEAGNEHWQERLWLVIRTLPVQALDESRNDSAFCYGGRGGHAITIGRYIDRQLDKRLLPSSQGPATRNGCFVRQASRRIISTGISGDEIGDTLLPYVVVNDFRDAERLRELRVETLDDVPSASTEALIRALKILGERLSTDWGEKEILSERARWRLIRGAIQDIYRTLNQRFPNDSSTNNWFTPQTKCAVRTNDQIKFLTGPFFYARPGSPIETAFRDKLPLFDADRPLPTLFTEVGVTELKPGETVEEHFEGATNFAPAKQLRSELQTQIAPLLLAYVISQFGSNASEQVLNRLERLEIRAVRNLSISFSLLNDPAITATVDYKHFYLQSELVARARGGRERQFTLYVKGTDAASIADIDADELGEILAIVFDDAPSAELQGTFARIVARYQAENGRETEMEEYLYSNLGISHEAQDSARAILSGEVVTAPAAPPPPPAQVHKSAKSQVDTDQAEDQASIAASLLKHQTQINSKTSSLVSSLATTSSKPGTRTTINVSQHQSGSPITPEQKKRGLDGEEEIKRRLQLPGGWEGFTLVKDRRDDGCGYDFLCELGGNPVALEIKTFIPGGRIFVTSGELQASFTLGTDYYLVGVLYEGPSPNNWITHILPDPAGQLLMNGEFVIQADLKLAASDLFDLSS